MIVTTSDYIPNKNYELIGLVTTIVYTNSVDDYFNKVAEKIKNKAAELHADAVIGFRASLVFEKELNTKTIYQTAYGTAVKFIDKETK